MRKTAIHTAVFSDGTVITSPRHNRHGLTHAWLSSGKLMSGKPWRLSGFAHSQRAAEVAMRAQTRHLQHTTTEFSEIATARVLSDAVSA